jgi:hypothetical protein
VLPFSCIPQAAILNLLSNVSAQYLKIEKKFRQELAILAFCESIGQQAIRWIVSSRLGIGSGENCLLIYTIDSKRPFYLNLTSTLYQQINLSYLELPVITPQKFFSVPKVAYTLVEGHGGSRESGYCFGSD